MARWCSSKCGRAPTCATPCRFDVVAIDGAAVESLQAAFDAS
jgi:Holliday junction resolvase-like predicted endonuclease